jgi:hypothetical protein
MVWIVITIHLLLSLGLLWATWQVWQLRLVLAAVANSVNGYAKACQQGLSVSPPAILTAKKGAAAAKIQYKVLLPQIQRVQLILSIVNRLQSLGKKFSKSRKSRSYNRKRSDRNVKRRW